jgi:radical SAM protein with 4Fe4S-binding SPASM domain
LTDGWMLRGWSDLPRALVNWKTGEQRMLKPMGFYVAESCDGRTDFESLAFLPKHRAMLELLMAAGVAADCRKSDRLESWQRYRKASNPRLSGLHWCVTGRCNLRCRHCYMEAPSGRYGELPFETMARLVDQFERANVSVVSLTGGEPFLRRDIIEIIRLLTQKRIRLGQIFSNGLLITNRHLEDIRALGLRPPFQVSLDGVGTHDRMRGAPGSEQGVTDAIRRLRLAGFPVVVSTCVDRFSLSVLPDTYELMNKLGVQAWRVSAPQETGNWRGTTTATTLDKQADVFVPLLKRWLDDGRPFGLQLCGFFVGGRMSPPEASGPARPAGRKPETKVSRPSREFPDGPGYMPESYVCGSCREQPNLLPDGTLVPCPGYVDSILQDRMPNLLREDLSDAWTRSFLREIVEMKKKDLFDRNPECATCELFKECGVGCRVSALTMTGDLMAKDPVMCELCKKGYGKRFREMAAGKQLSFGRRGVGGR